MKRFFLIAVFLFFLAGPALAALSREEALHLFVKADLAYKDGKYAEAIKFYGTVLAGGYESGALDYNLGNSYFKQGLIGKAILNYERARKLIPRDSDLRANRLFALAQIKGAPLSPSQSFIEKVVEKSKGALTTDELLWLWLGTFFLIAGLHITGLYYLPVRQRNVLPIWIAVTLAVAFISLFSLRVEQEDNQAIVLKETPAKFEPREEATTYFELNEGQKVRVRKNEGLWFKVERIDGKIGWTRADKFEKI